MSEENKIKYDEDSIKSLDWKEHIRLRPGMYIGKLGDGSSPDDGIYVLFKEVMDNCIDEFAMGNGKSIDIVMDDGGPRSGIGCGRDMRGADAGGVIAWIV